MMLPGHEYLWGLATVVVLVLGPPPVLAAGTVSCVNPDTEKTESVSIDSIKERAAYLQGRVEQGEFHILDLNAELRARRRRIQLDMNSGRWCVVRSHLFNLEGEVNTMGVDLEFVAEKFHRLLHWARNKPLSRSARGRVNDLFSEAADAMSLDRTITTNRKLNEILEVLYGGTRWDLPSESELLLGQGREVQTSGFVEIRDYEVFDACPNVNDQSRSTLKAVTRELVQALKVDNLRPLDLKDGELLHHDFQSYVGFGALWPAIRVACIMIDRTGDVEIGLKSVIQRFMRINELYKAASLDAESTRKFRALIRKAASRLAAQDFEKSHLVLNEALVILGEPASLKDYFADSRR